MDTDRSRLTSITEEEQEQEAEPRTQVSLLRVYHHLYAAEYCPAALPDPRAHFQLLSQKINQMHPSPYSSFQPLSEEA